MLATNLLRATGVSGVALPSNIEYLVIGGGGGIRTDYGGGSGAGGYRCSVIGESSGGGAVAESTFNPVLDTEYVVTVGAGGTSAVGNGLNGGNSVFATITSLGGGASSGGTGGSGGGGGPLTQSPAAGLGTANQGYDGGNGSATNNASAGGGGAGGAGGNASSSAGGAAGAGVSSSITGSAVTRAVGGRGANLNEGDGASGTANTGNGARGSYGGSSTAITGGSGIVIIRYLKEYKDLASVDAGLTCNGFAGNTTPTISGNYKIYSFTAGTGNIKW